MEAESCGLQRQKQKKKASCTFSQRQLDHSYTVVEAQSPVISGKLSLSLSFSLNKSVV